jgi:gamma-glutamylaminecyclotransferase
MFEVSEHRLFVLDQLEDIGKDGSFRSTVDVIPVGGGIPMTAVGFMKSEAWLDPFHSNYLTDYQDRWFVPPWQRA